MLVSLIGGLLVLSHKENLDGLGMGSYPVAAKDLGVCTALKFPAVTNRVPAQGPEPEMLTSPAA